VSIFNISTILSYGKKQLKGWNRKKKEALFNHDWQEIKKLAPGNNESSHENNKK
jgi:putative endonuclease